MSVSENILFFLSKELEENKQQGQISKEVAIGSALDQLHRVYPNLKNLISGNRVVDFGCGKGAQSIALVKKYDCSVVGIDSNPATLNRAIQNAGNHQVASEQLSFAEKVTPDMLGNFDIVISHNSFEHFPEPEKVLREMSSLLKPSGKILVTFGPPWYAPHGSHMRFFCRVPWINVLFSEETVMKVRSKFRNDGAKRYEEVESGLNKMTVSKFESIVSSCDLELTYKRYDCIKGINSLSKISLLREFFINHVTAILTKTK